MSKENPTNQELLNKIKSLEDELAVLKKSITEPKSKRNITNKDELAVLKKNRTEPKSKRNITNNNALITADSDIADINENVTLTASFSGFNGKAVRFYNGHELLGTSITNINGDASLTTNFDEAQIANVHASCDGRLTEPYAIKIGIFVYLNKDETPLTTNNLNPNNLRINGDFALEFDIKQTNTSGQLKLAFDGRDYSVTTHTGISHSNGTLISYREGTVDGHHYLASISTPYNKWYHLKMTRKGSVFSWYIDDILIDSKTLSTLGTETINILKGLKPNNGMGIVKNLIVYPI